MQMNMTTRWCLVLCFVSMWGCGGGSPSQSTPAVVNTTPSSAALTIAIAPASITISAGTQQTFLAVVNGAVTTQVNWSVQEGVTGGSITSAGLYSAPSNAGTFHVGATSQADPSKSAAATVTVTAPQPIAIAPTSITISAGAQQTFLAVVNGLVSTQVSWSVQEGPAGGSITSAGLYSAPNNAGTFHVVATSQADPSKSATATVTVTQVSVSIFPSSDVLAPGAFRQFFATVAPITLSDHTVTWSVQEGGAGGTITTTGLYNAPNALGTFHVVATSQADPSKNAIAPVIVTTHVTVSVTPSTDVLGPRGTRQFASSVTPTSITNQVSWSVMEGASGGTITSAGLYTAPTLIGIGTVHPQATSVADPSATGAASVALIAAGFQPTGFMNDTRSVHSATLLPSGKVLIAGGDATFFFAYYYGDFPLASAEIFDPATGSFTKIGVMSRTRVGHTATLLPNGKVLLAGGPDASAELYDPSTGKFALTGTMSVGRTFQTATQLNNGKVLMVGGANLTGALASAELYDPVSGTFAATGSLVQARESHSATLLADGKVLIAGGSDPNNSLADAEIYDPALGTFSATGSMGTARRNQSATLLNNGNVLIAGGLSNTGPLASAELYDPSVGTFKTAASMIFARDSHFAVKLPSGMALVAGGEDYTAELYDPITATFSQTGGLAVPRALAAGCLLLDGRVLVTGGSDTSSADIYK